jgi:DNA-directed RNA polymerase subunit K
MTMAKPQQQPESITYTKYEKARMIGSRALQLADGAPFLIDITPEELERMRFDPVQIALKEFEAGVLPITVKRPVPGKQ